MAFTVQTYDATQISILFAGIAISQGAGQSGYAEGEFLSVKFNDQFVLKKGTDGSATRAATHDREFTATLNLMQGNSLNPALSALLYADVNSPNGAGIGSFVVKDLQGTTLLSAPTSWLKAPADISFDLGAKGRAWPITGLWDIAVIG